MTPLNFDYLFPGMTPAWMQKMQQNYSYTSNQLNYAITDVRDDIMRLDEEFGV